MTEVADQIDYKKETFFHPTYRMNKILPQSGSQTFTLTAAGGNETILEIPVKAFNLYRSYFEFIVVPTAGLAALGTYKDVITSIRQLQLYTKSSVYLLDINEVGNYSKIVNKSD